MAEYHVGCGAFGIYAGTLKNEHEWRQKSNVTDEVLSAAAQFLLQSDESLRFEYQGKKYLLRVIQEG